MLQGDLKEALEFYDTFGVVNFNKRILEPNLKSHIAVKEAVFPFNKLTGSDLLLGPEMKSTRVRVMGDLVITLGFEALQRSPILASKEIIFPT